MLDVLAEEHHSEARLLQTEERPVQEPLPIPAATLALWVILATVVMLFAGFTSAYLVRRTAPDWVPVYAPPILWANTVVILLSSVALQFAKGAERKGRRERTRIWLLLSAVLGLLFLAGQVLAWVQLSALGIFLPTSPHGSFLYMLTGVHAVHVLGGLLALLYVLGRSWRRCGLPPASESVALYWHFVAGVWLFLYALLFIWR